MKIIVSGVREPANIRDIVSLGADAIGMVFNADSPRNVTMIPTHAGIIPDRGRQLIDGQRHESTLRRMGIFTDEMPQNIITRVVNFALDIILLAGNESPTVIRNLRATLVPDIQPRLQIAKSIRIGNSNDIDSYRAYADCVDYFRFDINNIRDMALLGNYDGQQPFFIGGNIAADDAAAVSSFKHQRFIGVELDENFETSPAVKDTTLLKKFIEKNKKIK